MNEYLPLLLVISFGVIIFLVAKRKNFAVAIFAGAFILSISIPGKIVDILIKTALDYRVISLMAIVIMIKMLAVMLKETGQIEKIISFLQSKLSYRGMLIAIPSILGLLPVPGGALLSAPLIDTHGKDAGVKKEELMAINLWYRHIWFIIFPLATPLVLLSDLSSFNIFLIIAAQIPMFLLAFFIGYLFIRKAKNVEMERENGKGGWKSLLPVILPASLAIPLSMFMSTYLAFLISLPLGLLMAWKMAERWDRKIIKEGVSITLALSIFAIMFLKNIIFESGLPEMISSHMSGMPPSIMIALLSFIIGLLTAHNLAAIGILYPVLSPFLDSLPMISLLYISAFMGYLISPIHPCIVLTYEYFKPKFTDAYKLLIPPSIAVVVIATLFYSFL